MIKVALFDVDNVIIKRREYFSQFLAREYKIPSELVMEFFKNEFKLCSLGKADLKEEIVKYFEKWGWEKSVDDLLRIWFENEKEIDLEVISAVEKLRRKEIKCYLATNQEKYRLNYLWENLKLKNFFDGVFDSCELGYSKSEKEFYQSVLGKLGDIKPEEIVFWDSDEKIVAAANEFGISGRLYTSLVDIQI